MESKDKETYNFSSESCRVCLKDKAQKNLCDTHSPTSLEYAAILASCTNIQINKDDELPTKICSKCSTLLVSFHRFKIRTIENDFKLRKSLEEKKKNNQTQTAIFTIESIQNVNILDENFQPISPNISPIEGQTFQLLSTVIINNEPVTETDKPVSYSHDETVTTDDLYFVTDSDSDESKSNETYLSKKPFSCSICNKRFTRTDQVLIHKRTHTGERPHKCLICKKTFIQYSTLKSHLRTHTSDKPHVCSTCGKSFKQPSSLTNHARIHTGETPYDCKVCGKGFKTSGNLSTHNKFHMKLRSYFCSLCDRSFVTSSHLRVHQKLHTGDRPHVCVVCNKAFARKEYLKCHLIVHSGKRPYECGSCNRTYTQSGHLLRHRRAVHGLGQCEKNLE